MSIAIVTDSTADIPAELSEKYSIHVVRNIVVIEGKSLEDGKDISREDFYNLLPELKSPPSTATASSGTYTQLYEKLFQQGAIRIISIHASRLLSGIINAASSAAQAFGDKVQVIDSESITLGLGFQVLAAAEAVARGMSLENILALLEGLRKRVRVVALLDTLEYVRRSGRVSWGRASLGNMLQIKPLVEVKNGLIHSLGEVRTHRKGIERLQEFLLKLGPLEQLALLHTNAENEARNLLASLNLQLATNPLFINVTTVIGTHVGPNGLGFAAVVK